MKTIGLKLSSLCFVLVLLLCSAMPALADDTKSEENTGKAELRINNAGNVKAGDIVTYTLYLSETVEPIVGFELRLFYDSEHLEYQKSSLKFENFDVVIYNEDIKGKIPMNCSSLTNLPQFEKKGQFVTASFKVIKGGESSITYFFTELYGENLTYLKKYKLTYDLSVGDKKLVEDGVPPVNADEDTLNNNQGDFINYVDGMGEENSPNKGESHERIGSAIVNRVVELTGTADSVEADKGGFWGSTAFILIAGLLVVGAIVAAVIIVSTKNKSIE